MDMHRCLSTIYGFLRVFLKLNYAFWLTPCYNGFRKQFLGESGGVPRLDMAFCRWILIRYCLLISSFLQGASRLSFCIGGPYGHGQQLRQRANLTIKLSSMVLNHQIALLVLMEQLYRLLFFTLQIIIAFRVSFQLSCYIKGFRCIVISKWYAGLIIYVH